MGGKIRERGWEANVLWQETIGVSRGVYRENSGGFLETLGCQNVLPLLLVV